MTDEFDFDFDVDRGRSASRTEDRGSNRKETPETGNGRSNGASGNGHGNGSGGNGRGNGSRRFTSRAKELLERPDLIYGDEEEDERENGRTEPPAAPLAPDEGDWLSIGDDDFTPGSRSPLRERDDGPAGPPPPGEPRNSAREARRRASRRPSPILDLDQERERLAREQRDEDVDFESVLQRHPQKSGVARRG